MVKVSDCGHPLDYWAMGSCLICARVPEAIGIYASKLCGFSTLADLDRTGKIFPGRLEFAQTIVDRPDDEPPKLVFADWLDEQGDPRGNLIRVECELKRIEQDAEPAVSTDFDYSTATHIFLNGDGDRYDDLSHRRAELRRQLGYEI